MGFVHLKVKTGYTFMESTVQLNALVNRANEIGTRALAITDRHNMHGCYAFYKLCRAHQIKPIIGIEATIEYKEYALDVLIYAKNYEGYQNLMKWTSSYHLNKKPLAYSEYIENAEHVKLIIPMHQINKMATESRENEESVDRKVSQQMLRLFLEDWPEATYVGVESSNAERVGSYPDILDRFIALGDVRYVNPGDEEAYHFLKKMKDNSYKTSENQGDKHHLFTSEEANTYFREQRLIDQTDRFIKDIEVILPKQKPLLPKFPLNKGDTKTFLEIQCQKKLKQYYPGSTEAEERLSYELDVINQMGFNDYFLIVSDFITFAKANEIMVGPGRGSAAGSIVSYLLGITTVDPLAYDLLFERFLNPERLSMPDIDIDFSDHGRGKVIDYVRDKYGQANVAQIATFGTFKIKSIINELVKVMEIDERDHQYISKIIAAHPGLTLVQVVKASSELLAYIKDSDQLKRLFKVAKVLENLPRNLSTHAAGVVIYHEPLHEVIPLTVDQDNQPLTQYPMGELEAIGLLKIDFLSLKNLTIIERIVKDVQKSKSDFSLEDIDYRDNATFDIFKKGDTLGIFQFESPGMREALEGIQPSLFEDIVAAMSLYRPGPMEHIPDYIKRKFGKEPIPYLHPDLEPILKPTYGVLVYQEQIMRITNEFAGLSFGKADLLRRAISKKNKESLNQAESWFISGCISQGYDEKVAEKLFSWILKFASYGFNRSHAVSYSKIAYQMAFLKAHYPKAFYTALLNDLNPTDQKFGKYVVELKNKGITLHPPSINQSFHYFTTDDTGIRMGLKSIKSLPYPVINAIIQVRKKGPFQSLFDFCRRLSSVEITRGQLEVLILAGAFDLFNVGRASLLASLDKAMTEGKLYGGMGESMALFGEYFTDEKYEDVEDFSLIDQLMYEKDFLGLFISEHPLESNRHALRKQGLVNSTFIEAHGHLKNSYKLACFVQEIKVIKTKKGESMAFVDLDDESGALSGVMFPEQYREVRSWIKEHQFISIEGKLDERNGQKQLIINKADPLDFRDLNEVKQTKTCFIKLTTHSPEQARSLIHDLALEWPGDMPVILYDANKKESYRLKANYYLTDQYQVKKKMIEAFGKDNVVIQSNEKK